jgi:hypothetical protein
MKAGLDREVKLKRKNTKSRRLSTGQPPPPLKYQGDLAFPSTSTSEQYTQYRLQVGHTRPSRWRVEQEKYLHLQSRKKAIKTKRTMHKTYNYKQYTIHKY